MNPESAPFPRRTPAILVADDDPASARFFQAALQASGYATLSEGDGYAALGLARQRCFDLLLLDCHMPGIAAMQILARLRADPAAASHATLAIATSAELDAPLCRRLREGGFADTLSKPVGVDRLRATVAALLEPMAATSTPLLDNRAALESSGTPAAMHALRGLFAGELRRLDNEWEPLAAQPSALAQRLHRLLASCGFCGANALAEACVQLKQALGHDGGAPPRELERFRHTLALTLHEIEGRVADGD